MPKISDYALNTNPDIENDHVVTAYAGQNYKVVPENIRVLQSNFQIQIPCIEDFSLRITGVTPMCVSFIYVSAGVAVDDEVNHPGIAYADAFPLTYKLPDTITARLITGGETFEAIIRIQNSTTLVSLIGFADAVTVAGVVDGAWLNIAGDTLTGKTSNNSAVSTTPSSYVLALNTWYRLKMQVNETATAVNFYLYDSATNALLWSATLTTNIPTAAGRSTTGVFHAITGAGGRIDFDWIAYYCTKELTR